MSINIGIAGGKGSYSEEAAGFYCQKNNISDCEITYLLDSENVLKNLVNKKIDQGIIPIVNSVAGLVSMSIYAIAKYNFNIKEIFQIPIIHNLMALPGIKKEEIKKIVSHEQSLKQCKKYLGNNFPTMKIVEWEDNGKAASDLANGILASDTAVIASKRAAEIYGMHILEAGIQDSKDNLTTFLALVP